MMMTSNNQKKSISAVLALILVLQMFSFIFTAFAANATVEISNEKQFISFAKKCKTDSWSRGKTVVLKNDVDLSKTSFEPIATFGGTFEGNGHTIKGVKITKKGSYQGLFRYVQKTGVINNLNVSGSVIPGGTKSYVGGICGQNSGIIKNSKFDGTVKGENNVGGICGYQTETGSIIASSFYGNVTANSYTGGIAGQNFGEIQGCENHGKINTKSVEAKKPIEDLNIDLENVRSTQNISAITDTGGICGFSKGKITGCTNYGNIGLKSIGYNTGGICGRHSGYISECVNKGVISGRKDIGGICGQAEPYVTLEFSKDVLYQMKYTLLDIKSIIDNNVNSSDDAISDSLTNINDAASDVSDKLEYLSDDLVDYADDLTDKINDILDRTNTALNSSDAVFDDVTSGTDKMADGLASLRKSGDYLADVTDYLNAALDNAKDSGDDLNAARKYILRSVQKMSKAMSELQDFTEKISVGHEKLQKSLASLSTALKDKKDAEKAFKDLWSSIISLETNIENAADTFDTMAEVLDDLNQNEYVKEDISNIIKSLKALANCYKNVGAALRDVGDALLLLSQEIDLDSITSFFKLMSQGLDNMSQSFDKLGDASDDLKLAIDNLKLVTDNTKLAIEHANDGLDSFKQAANYLSSASDKLKDIVDEVKKDGKIVFPLASDRFTNTLNELFDSVDVMKNRFTDFNDTLKDKKNDLKDEFNKVSAKLDMLSDILTDAYDETLSKTEKDDYIKDVSDNENSTDIRGKTELSKNYGKVYGDLNTGGIIGSMAIEYDFDPEDDVTKNGSNSFKFIYKTKAVARRCQNNGIVESNKNYAGGICGKMDLGSIFSCENYGDIKSVNGNYAGGICGKSDSVIRNCAAKSTISGTDYIGGIAGEGSTITNCYSLVNIKDYGEYAGTVAGYASSGSVLKNYTVNDSLGAIDDINYDGIAEKTSEKSFADFVKSTFGTNVKFKLTFVADGKKVKTLDFTYKEPISEDDIPKIPVKKGYYGKWSDYDFDNPTYSATIEAEYQRNMDIISSDKKRNGKSVVILCGNFNDDVHIDVKPQMGTLKHHKTLDAYKVSISGTHTKNYTIRYLPSLEKGYNIYVKYGDKAEKIKIKKFGSYVQFEVPKSTFTIYEVKKNYAAIIVFSLLIFLVAAAIILAIIKRFKSINFPKFKMPHFKFSPKKKTLNK